MDSPAPRPPVEPVRVVPLDDAAYVAAFAVRLVTEHKRAPVGCDRIRLAYAATAAALPYVGLHDMGERLRGDALRLAIATL
jgi:hypothetical protein